MLLRLDFGCQANSFFFYATLHLRFQRLSEIFTMEFNKGMIRAISFF